MLKQCFYECVTEEVELRPVSGRLEIRVVDRSNDGSTHTPRDAKRPTVDISKPDTKGKCHSNSITSQQTLSKSNCDLEPVRLANVLCYGLFKHVNFFMYTLH